MKETGLAIADPNNPGKLIFNTGAAALSQEKMAGLQPALIESAELAGAKTLTGLYTAFTTWKTANSNKQAIFIPVMGGDGIPGIIALYK